MTKMLFIALLYICFLPQSYASLPLNYYDNDDVYVNKIQSFGDGLDRFDLSVSESIGWLDINIPDCRDIRTSLLDCIPNVCRESKGGVVKIRQVDGYHHDFCVFHEKFLYQGSLTCVFNPEESQEVAHLLDEINNGDKFQVLATDLEKIKTFYQTKCLRNERERYNAIVLPGSEDEYATEVLKIKGVFNKPPGSKLLNILVPKLVDEARTRDDTEFWYNNSIMFFDDEYRELQPVVERWKARNNAELNRIARTNKRTTQDDLRIRSYIYISDLKWHLWLNNYNLSSDRESKKFTVLGVDRNGVTILWNITNIDNVSRNWRQNYRYIGDAEYLSNDERSVITQIDDVRYTIKFTLKLGEVLLLDTLLITEEVIQ